MLLQICNYSLKFLFEVHDWVIILIISPQFMFSVICLSSVWITDSGLSVKEKKLISEFLFISFEVCGHYYSYLLRIGEDLLFIAWQIWLK